jgi:hypothetical protein
MILHFFCTLGNIHRTQIYYISFQSMCLYTFWQKKSYAENLLSFFQIHLPNLFSKSLRYSLSFTEAFFISLLSYFLYPITHFTIFFTLHLFLPISFFLSHTFFFFLYLMVIWLKFVVLICLGLLKLYPLCCYFWNLKVWNFLFFSSHIYRG